jgi:choline dehydrogenase
MQYMRGHPADYERWRSMGNPGWGYDDVLPYFLRSEGHESRLSPYHSQSGPLHVQKASSPNPLYPAFIRAAVEAGFTECADFNGESQEGFGRYEFNIRNGRRWSVARAFLDDARKRPNLRVVPRAHTTRVLVRGHRAIGVEYRRLGRTIEVHADAEVVLCAGAIHSPALLLHSGIGDAAHLSKLGIATTAHLPAVGRNLQDHPTIALQFGCTQPITLHSMVRVDRAALMMAQAMLLRTGPATSFPVEAGGFSRSRPGLDRPNLQWHMIIGLGLAALRWPGINDSSREGFSIGINNLDPTSRGSISLTSSDPFASPRIDSGFLSDPEDVQILVEAVAQVRKVASQPALAPFVDGELAPGVTVQSREEVASWVRSSVGSGKHPCGTCRMGSGEDAVVDPQLRVRGVDRLRVVDASVMPSIVSGGLNATTIMIAEKAADLIGGKARAASAAI